MTKVVLFSHPGKEHLTFNNGYKFYSELKSAKKNKFCIENGFMPWNNSEKHARKFMTVTGDYVDNKGEVHYQESIAFWGEWEQESYVKRLEKNDDNSPQLLQIPYCKNDEVTDMLKNKDKKIDIYLCNNKYGFEKQNTDPYVFGDRFYYSCCKQQRVKMRNLEVGDVIIFYSAKGHTKNNNYTCSIDTVFVIGGYVEVGGADKNIVYEKNIEELRNSLTAEYMNGAILPICFGNGGSLGSNGKNTLYYAATYDNKVNGMYSFFPCKKWTENDKVGFKRFEVLNVKEKNFKGENYFNFPINQYQVIKYNTILNETKEDVFNYWNELKNAILDDGYYLGIKANEPTLL